MRKRSNPVMKPILIVGIGVLCLALTAQGNITPTERGATVETPKYRIEFRNGVLVSMFNKLTREQYLDSEADLSETVAHLPSGLGSQYGETARKRAKKLYHWPWWEHPNDLYLPNQHYPDDKSRFAFEKTDGGAKLIYTGLTDGNKRFEDETFSLLLQVEEDTGHLLVTPGGQSRQPGVYAANLTLAPLAPAVTAEAPITDGLQITRENTGEVLWMNQWPDYWQYGLVAFNGWKTGAFAIWTQDQKLRYYKHLMYLKNDEGLSFSLSMMNVPPFEDLKKAKSAVPWRIQAFDKSWAQAAARYRKWRDENVKMAPRPDFSKRISVIASVAGPQGKWLNNFLRYVKPWQGRAAAFLTCVRREGFDHNHADNTPYDGFAEDVKNWEKAGTYGMAYLQPMIMWGPFAPEKEMTNPKREKKARKLHTKANTRLVFQKDSDTVVKYVDQHHLGHPGWQQWILGWVNEYCQDFGAQGIYHDQSYHAPIDRRGLSVGGMTSPEGMADYFYKAATQNPDTFHGTEMVTEANAVGASNSIGSGYHWGTAPHMRLARAYSSSPITAALAHP